MENPRRAGKTDALPVALREVCGRPGIRPPRETEETAGQEEFIDNLGKIRYIMDSGRRIRERPALLKAGTEGAKLSGKSTGFGRVPGK